MARGNQREKAREKNLKKQTKAKKKEDGTAFKKRAESDAEIMRQKQQKAQKAEDKKGGEGGEGTQNKQ